MNQPDIAKTSPLLHSPGRQTIRRLVSLTLIAFCVGGMHIAALLNAGEIATYGAPYSPPTVEEVRRMADKSLEECLNGPFHTIAGRPCERDSDSEVSARHLGLYQQKVFRDSDVVKEWVNVAFGVIYGLVGLSAAWAVLRWLAPHARRGSATLLASADVLRSKLPIGISTTRRFRLAEEQFGTLKSLLENGLISDEVYEQRKAAIKASLQRASAASGNG